MNYNVGETLETLPEKGAAFGSGGKQPLLVRRGWDLLMKASPNRWVVLDMWTKEQATGKNKTNGSGFRTRAKMYNEKYSHLGFMFEVRNVDGKIIFFGRYNLTNNAS